MESAVDGRMQPGQARRVSIQESELQKNFGTTEIRRTKGVGIARAACWTDSGSTSTCMYEYSVRFPVLLFLSQQYLYIGTAESPYKDHVGTVKFRGHKEGSLCEGSF